MSHADESDRIDAIVESVLARLQRGEQVDVEEVVLANQDIKPLLVQRLDVLKGVFTLASNDLDEQPSAIFIAPDANLSTMISPPSHPTPNMVDCTLCGTVIKLDNDSLDEITCDSCGHIVALDSMETRSLASPLLELGHFKLLEVIGQGGFGIVYRAHDTVLDRTVAIKLPRPDYFQTSDQQERFMREARHAARLSHPGIVPVYEIGKEKNNSFIVSNYIDGLSLAEFLSIKDKSLEFRQTTKIVRQICEAVDYAHANNVIHRDLKPNNILLDQEQQPYVTDFGLSRFIEGEVTITIDGQAIGTPAYMSPEQVIGEQAKITAATDIYSLGVILYRMLTGELPFRGGKRAIMYQVLHEDPVPLRSIDESVPLDLETITLKAMAKEPGRRYSSAGELAADLRRFQQGEPIIARPVGQVEKLSLWCRRQPAIATLACSLALLLVATSLAGIIWGYRESNYRAKIENSLQRETEAVHENKTILARQYTSNGSRHLASGDHLLALPWLVKAWQTDQSNSVGEIMDREMMERDRIHRVRIGTTLKHSPKLVSVKADESRVQDAILSQDSRLAVSAFFNGKLLAWDIETGRILIEHDYAGLNLYDVEISSDAKCLVVALSDGTVRIWDMNGEPKSNLTLQHDSLVTEICFQQNSHLIATRRLKSNEAMVWNCDNGELIAKLEHDNTVRRVLFAKNSVFTSSDAEKKRAETGKDPVVQNLYRWDLNDPTREHLVYASTSEINQLKFDNNQQLLLAINNDQSICWNIELSQKVFAIEHDHMPVTGRLADNDRFLSVLNDGEIEIWNTLDGSKLQTIETGDRVKKAVISDDRKMVAIASEGGATFVWRIDPPGLICPELHHANTLSGIECSSGGRYLMTFGFDGLVKIWDIRSAILQQPSVLYDSNINSPIAGLAFSPDSQLVAVAARDHCAYIRSVQTGKLLGQPLQHPGAVIRNDFAPDGAKLATACSDGVVRLWDVATCQQLLVEKLMKHDAFVSRIQFSPNGKSIASGDYLGVIKVWNAETGEKRFEMKHDYQPLNPTHHINCLAFSPDGKQLASTSTDGTARIWNLATGDPQTEPLVHQSPPLVMTCRFSPDGKKVITASQDYLSRIWDAQTGKLLAEPLLHNASVWDARFHPSDDLILTASNDGNVYVWENIDAPRVRLHFKTFGVNFSNYVIPFAMDGQVIMTATNNPISWSSDRRRLKGAVQLWDTATGDLVSPLLPHFDDFTAADISPDSMHVVAADKTGTLRFWNLTTEERSRDEVESIVEILSGHRFHPRSGLVPIGGIELAQRWEELRKRNVPEFTDSNYLANDDWDVPLVPLK